MEQQGKVKKKMENDKTGENGDECKKDDDGEREKKGKQVRMYKDYMKMKEEKYRGIRKKEGKQEEDDGDEGKRE